MAAEVTVEPTPTLVSIRFAIAFSRRKPEVGRVAPVPSFARDSRLEFPSAKDSRSRLPQPRSAEEASVFTLPSPLPTPFKLGPNA